MVFNTTIASSSDAKIQCWRDTLTGGDPIASDTHLEALKVGSVSSTSVTG
jgi:hypothetical protein